MNNLRQREIAQIAAERAPSPAIEHSALAEMSNMAAVAAGRLQPGRTLSADDLRFVLGLLRSIETIGLVGFLRRHGSEEDYRSIGASIARRYTLPPRRS